MIRREQRRQPIRIVYVVENGSFRGGERAVLQLASGLPRARYEAAVVCGPGGPLVEGLQDLGIPVIDTNWSGGQWQTLWTLVKELRRRAPDIVHGRGRLDTLTRVAARLARVPIVVSSLTSSAPTAPPDRWGVRRLLEVATARLVDRYMVVDRASVPQLAARDRIAAAKFVVVPDGIEVERYDPARRTRGAWRAQHGVPNDAIVVGGLGQLARHKGFEDLLRAFARLDDPRLFLAVAGEGDEWADLRSLAGVLDVPQRVLFPGRVDDVPGFLVDLDLFVLPSHQEGHPMALLEAMAMARPVIATDIPGISDTISDGVDGRLVSAGDIDALAAAIESLVGDRQVATRFGRSARKKVEREHTLERMVRRTALLYDELVQSK